MELGAILNDLGMALPEVVEAKGVGLEAELLLELEKVRGDLRNN